MLYIVGPVKPLETVTVIKGHRPHARNSTFSGFGSKMAAMANIGPSDRKRTCPDNNLADLAHPPPGSGDWPEPVPAAGRPERAAHADVSHPVPDQALVGAGLHADLPPAGGDGPAGGQLRLHLHEKHCPLHLPGQPLLVSGASERRVAVEYSHRLLLMFGFFFPLDSDSFIIILLQYWLKILLL